MDTTDRVKLALLVAGQTHKEVMLNENFLLIDLLAGGLVESGAASAPPAAPVAGRFYLVGPGATGAWAGEEGALAAFTPGGWRFLVPFEGLCLTERGTALEWRRSATGWEVGTVRATRLLVDGQPVVGPRQPAIATPTGGSTVDPEARTALAAILTAMRGHGLIET